MNLLQYKKTPGGDRHMKLNELTAVNARVFKALESIGVETVEQLCERTYEELKKVKGVGVIGMVELKRALKELGLELRKSVG